jgi:hypothetical protein
VLATASTGQTSEPSEPRKFIIVPRGSGSRVPASNLAAELLGGNLYLIRGRAEPGTTIRIAGRETIVQADGNFQMQVTAPSGAREITIDAEDQRGNSTPYHLSLAGRADRGKD